MSEDGDDPSCYMVQETTFDYEYDETFDWSNMTAMDCNCTHPLHKYLEVSNMLLFIFSVEFKFHFIVFFSFKFHSM